MTSLQVQSSVLSVSKCSTRIMQQPSASSSSPPLLIAGHHEIESTQSLDIIKSFLRRSLRIKIKDGRIFIGTFAGTDQLLNVILINTEEYRVLDTDTPQGRYVGQVMIPWPWVVKAEVQGDRKPPIEDKMDGLHDDYNNMYF